MTDTTALTSGTVKLPGVGPVKKVYVYVGVGAVGVLAAYLMYRRQQAMDQADAVPADADLGTGLTTPGAGSDVYQGATAGGDPTPDPDITPMPTSNVEWTQQVLDYFTWLEPTFVSATVGKYLGRQPLTSDEASFVRQAWAARGKPPEGPDTFTMTNDGNSPGTPAAPDNATKIVGMHVSGTTKTTITVDWGFEGQKPDYIKVYKNGVPVPGDLYGTYTTYKFTGLKAGTKYNLSVRGFKNEVPGTPALVQGSTAK
jgi:hypothetical protein